MGEQIGRAEMREAAASLRAVLVAVDAEEVTVDLDHVAYLRGAVAALTALAEGRSETNPNGTEITASPCCIPTRRSLSTTCISLPGKLPDEGQLHDVGWWDPVGQGVLQLTAGDDWVALYPPDSDDVLAAPEAAHAETFEPRIALPRRKEEELGARRRGGAGTAAAVSLREFGGRES